jgi:hypothetical protein
MKFASMLRFLLALLTCCVALPALGADVDVLAGVRERLVLTAQTQGEFVQTRRLADIRKPLVSNGRFVVARGLGVIWEDLRPFTRTLRLTRDEILQTDGERTLMHLTAAREPVVGIVNAILFGVLAGDLDALGGNFDHSGALEPGGRWRLDFTPRDARLGRMIRSLAMRGGRDVESVELTSAAGDVTTIEFKAQTHADTIAADVRKRFEQ